VELDATHNTTTKSLGELSREEVPKVRTFEVIS